MTEKKHDNEPKHTTTKPGNLAKPEAQQQTDAGGPPSINEPPGSHVQPDVPPPNETEPQHRTQRRTDDEDHDERGRTSSHDDHKKHK